MKKSFIVILFYFVGIAQLFACICDGPFEFDSRNDLLDYSFIALVAVDSIYDLTERTSYQADITIIELFKGAYSGSLFVGGGNPNVDDYWTSCDIGINANEKWVVFAYKDDNRNYETHFCTFSTRYSNDLGERDWQFKSGIKELEKLRYIFGHENTKRLPVEGVVKTKYFNGNIEMEEEYKNGVRDGKRTIYYANGMKMLEESFVDGKQTGKSYWYDKKGYITRNFNFKNGHPVDTCYYFWNGYDQVQSERIYDQNGGLLKNKEWSIDGIKKHVWVLLPEVNESHDTSFLKSGSIDYISIRDSKNYQNLRYYQYYENGQLEYEVQYFPIDQKIDLEIRKYREDGKLQDHYRENKDKVRTNLLESNRF